jgi:LPXTG-motif cell wall-anchored protein
MAKMDCKRDDKGHFIKGTCKPGRARARKPAGGDDDGLGAYVGRFIDTSPFSGFGSGIGGKLLLLAGVALAGLGGYVFIKRRNAQRASAPGGGVIGAIKTIGRATNPSDIVAKGKLVTNETLANAKAPAGSTTGIAEPQSNVIALRKA